MPVRANGLLFFLMGVLTASIAWLLGGRSQLKELFEGVLQSPVQASVAFTGHQKGILS